MIAPDEWEKRIKDVAAQLDGLTVSDAGAVLTGVLIRLISQAPPELQMQLTMSLATMLVGKAEPEELH